MCRKKIMTLVKKKFAGVLAIAAMLSGLIIPPVMSNAEEAVNIPDVVNYDDQLDISKYWNTSNKKVPVKEGYVFGGWFTAETINGEVKYTALEEENIQTDDEGNANVDEKTYAKFVPAYVLSVKAQIEEEAVNGEAKSTCVRVLSSVDSLNYKSVGFDIWFNNKWQQVTPEIVKVYSQLRLDPSNASEEPKTPGVEFGTVSKYFSALRIKDIAEANYTKIIYTRPYWVTMDGTKVEGLAKYVRVEDGIDTNHYISIPINLLEQKSVAAGMVELSYAAYKDILKVATNAEGTAYKIDAGRVLPEMEYYVDTENCKITFVGNATNVDEYKNTESIYANIRFQVKEGVMEEQLPGRYTFIMTEGEFCDWGENEVKDVKAWDTQY